MKNTLCFDTIFRFCFSAFSFRIESKLALLTQEVIQAAKRPNFVSIICQALEGSGRSLGGRSSSPRVMEVRETIFSYYISGRSRALSDVPACNT